MQSYKKTEFIKNLGPFLWDDGNEFLGRRLIKKQIQLKMFVTIIYSTLCWIKL